MANPWLTPTLKNVRNFPGGKQISPFNWYDLLTFYLLLQIIFIYISRGMHCSNQQLSLAALQSCLFHSCSSAFTMISFVHLFFAFRADMYMHWNSRTWVVQHKKVPMLCFSHFHFILISKQNPSFYVGVTETIDNLLVALTMDLLCICQCKLYVLNVIIIKHGMFLKVTIMSIVPADDTWKNNRW